MNLLIDEIMQTKRIIPCLDIKEGRTVKGINFKGLRDAGDPVELAKRYVKEGADELVFLDITATLENRKTLTDLAHQISKEISIPFTVGGGIKALEEAQLIIESGADKVSISSAALKTPELIMELAKALGSEKIVVAIDFKTTEEGAYVYTKGGTEKTEWKLEDWAKKVEELGAGEILLTAMDKDGTKVGFALEETNNVSRKIDIPVIASGGAGEIDHFADLFKNTNADAGLAASIFHFGEVRIPELKKALKEQNIPVK